MVTINAVLIKRCQSACNTNSLSATREAMATSSALKPQGSLADERNKSIVRSSWVSQRYSSRDDNYHHRSVKHCDTSATNAKKNKQHSMQVTADRSGKIMPQISRDKHGFNNKTYKKDFASKKKKEAVVTRTLPITRNDCWTSCDPNCSRRWGGSKGIRRHPTDDKRSSFESNLSKIQFYEKGISTIKWYFHECKILLKISLIQISKRYFLLEIARHTIPKLYHMKFTVKPCKW